MMRFGKMSDREKYIEYKNQYLLYIEEIVRVDQNWLTWYPLLSHSRQVLKIDWLEATLCKKEKCPLIIRYKNNRRSRTSYITAFDHAY